MIDFSKIKFDYPTYQSIKVGDWLIESQVDGNLILEVVKIDANIFIKLVCRINSNDISAFNIDEEVEFELEYEEGYCKLLPEDIKEQINKILVFK